MNYIKADFNLDQDTVMSKYLRCAKKKKGENKTKKGYKKKLLAGERPNNG